MFDSFSIGCVAMCTREIENVSNNYNRNTYDVKPGQCIVVECFLYRKLCFNVMCKAKHMYEQQIPSNRDMAFLNVKTIDICYGFLALFSVSNIIVALGIHLRSMTLPRQSTSK